MSVYKVPQDVEAEDKLIWIFSLKQFIFLIVAAVSAWMTFILVQINVLLIIFTLPLVIIFSILGIYRRADQPVETYLASLIRFYLKPRRRIWSQDGIMEPVIITVPPKIDHHYTDGRSKQQVRSQLRNLANVMDTRGWATKNTNLQVPTGVIGGDRLIAASDLPVNRQPSEVHASDDILDYNTNSVAQTMSHLAQGSVVAARQAAIGTMQPSYNPPPEPQQNPQTSFQQQSYSTSPVVAASTAPQTQATSAMTQAASPDIIRLSQNSDFNVSTIARQARQVEQVDLEEETEISLH